MGTPELCSSSFKTKYWFLSQTKGGALSVKLQTLQSRMKNKSLKYMFNRNGPRTDPVAHLGVTPSKNQIMYLERLIIALRIYYQTHRHV